MTTARVDLPGLRDAPLLWRFIRAVVGAARWKVALAVGLMALLGLTSGAVVLILVPLLQAAGLDVGPGSHQTSRLFSWVLGGTGARLSFGASLTVLVLVTAAQGALNLVQLRLSAVIDHDLVSGLRARLFDRVCRMEWSQFSRYRSSDLFETLTAQIDRVGYAAQDGLACCSSAAAVLVYSAIALSISVRMTGLSLVTGSLMVLVLRRYRGRAARAGREHAEVNKGLYSTLGETLSGMKTIRAYGAESQHTQSLTAIAGQQRRLSLRWAGAAGTNRLWFDVGAMSVLAIIAFLALRQLAVPLAELVVLLFVFMRLTPQLSSLHQSYQSLLFKLPAFGAVAALEGECEKAAEVRPTDPTDSPNVSFGRELLLDRVSFSYDRAPVLDEVTLAIPRGRTIAVVGSSGAGKTTLADIVLGLLKPTKGRLLVDGLPLASDQIAAWRRLIGYVPQDTLLFHDTIRANLLWAAPAAAEVELWEALETAAGRFVAELPDGLETIVGDRGVLLSGGERQRLALARALLRRPELLILDEATSSLDSENERLIEQAIDRLHGQVAILLITHRLSTVKRADAIYVLDGGRIVEFGTWNDLLAIRNGRFQALCRAQGIEPRADVRVAPLSPLEKSQHVF